MRLFVWDYHGVLEKGSEFAVIEVTNAVLEQNRLPARLTLPEADDLAGQKWRDYFPFLLPNRSPEEYVRLEAECLAMVRGDPEILKRHIRPNDYAHRILDAVASRHEQIVISNTSPIGLQHFLELTGMKCFFPEGSAFGVHAQNGVTKREALTTYLNGREYERIVAVGDSAHDLIGTVNYLYARPGKKPRQSHADYHINDLREVAREL